MVLGQLNGYLTERHYTGVEITTHKEGQLKATPARQTATSASLPHQIFTRESSIVHQEILSVHQEIIRFSQGTRQLTAK